MEENNTESAVVGVAKSGEGAVHEDTTVATGEEYKYRFGCGPFKPLCLQRIFRNPVFFTLILSIQAIVEGSVTAGTKAICFQAHTSIAPCLHAYLRSIIRAYRHVRK